MLAALSPLRRPRTTLAWRHRQTLMGRASEKKMEFDGEGEGEGEGHRMCLSVTGEAGSEDCYHHSTTATAGLQHGFLGPSALLFWEPWPLQGRKLLLLPPETPLGQRPSKRCGGLRWRACQAPREMQRRPRKGEATGEYAIRMAYVMPGISSLQGYWSFMKNKGLHMLTCRLVSQRNRWVGQHYT